MGNISKNMIDTPITKKFYKKLELYIELRRQNKRVKKSPRGEMIWSMEKAFLLWAVRGHWHLGTPLTPEYIKDRLIEDGFKENQVKWATQVAQNLVFKKFAYTPTESDKNAIQLTNDGFLMGEVIEEANSYKEYFYVLPIIFIWLSLALIFFEVIKKIIAYL